MRETSRKVGVQVSFRRQVPVLPATRESAERLFAVRLQMLARLAAHPGRGLPP